MFDFSMYRREKNNESIFDLVTGNTARERCTRLKTWELIEKILSVSRSRYSFPCQDTSWEQTDGDSPDLFASTVYLQEKDRLEINKPYQLFSFIDELRLFLCCSSL